MLGLRFLSLNGLNPSYAAQSFACVVLPWNLVALLEAMLLKGTDFPPTISFPLPVIPG